MRFLRKNNLSPVLSEGLSYDNTNQRTRIRYWLHVEQKWFCAYSERFIHNSDETHVEHFDPRQKNTVHDNYYNWYSVLPWMNSHKSKSIDSFLPILAPSDPSVATRIKYEGGMFLATDDNDIEAKNLIEFLGVNKFEVYLDRKNHINLLQSVRALSESPEQFVTLILENRFYLSFSTAIENELKLDVNALLDQIVDARETHH